MDYPGIGCWRYRKIFDDGFIAILTNGIEIESARPEFTTPEQFLDLRMMFEYFLCSNALNYLHNPAG